MKCICNSMAYTQMLAASVRAENESKIKWKCINIYRY